jgi:hypothetical protein
MKAFRDHGKVVDDNSSEQIGSDDLSESFPWIK